MRWVLFPILCILSFAGSALGQATASKIVTGGQFFYFSDESQQGGKELPGGVNTYMQFNVQYNRTEYFTGVGLFVIHDQAGESQKNDALGMKLEFFVPTTPYYLDFGYGFNAGQKFTNRSAETRTGFMNYLGFGVRVPLFTYVFFDGSLKQRTWTLKKEDGVTLGDPISRTERIPYLGLGMEFPM